MKARQLIDGATSFGPDAVKAMGQAFDESWVDIAGNFGADATIVEGARMRLANAVLSAAGAGIKDVSSLKRAAMKIISQNYSVLGITDSKSKH